MEKHKFFLTLKITQANISCYTDTQSKGFPIINDLNQIVHTIKSFQSLWQHKGVTWKLEIIKKGSYIVLCKPVSILSYMCMCMYISCIPYIETCTCISAVYPT